MPDANFYRNRLMRRAEVLGQLACDYFSIYMRTRNNESFASFAEHAKEAGELNTHASVLFDSVVMLTKASGGFSGRDYVADLVFVEGAFQGKTREYYGVHHEQASRIEKHFGREWRQLVGVKLPVVTKQGLYHVEIAHWGFEEPEDD